MEDWKCIPSYPNYQASTLGQIRHSKTLKILKPYNVPNGYSQVRLSLGSRTDFVVTRVHRLVAETWIPNPDNKPTVNHINRDHFDNKACNLEWMTSQEQSKHFTQLHTHKASINTRKCIKYETLHDEVWKDIDEFPEYIVSNLGRIKRRNIEYVLQGHSKSVYDQVKIKNASGAYVTKYIHKLVAAAFLQDYDPKLIVNHIDGDKKNNKAENLECISQSKNLQHAYDNNLIKTINVFQYLPDGTLIGRYNSFAHVEKETGYKQSTIRWSCKHDTRHGGFIWKTEDKVF